MAKTLLGNYWPDMVLRGCLGKKGHRSQLAAEEARSRLVRNLGTQGKLDVYRCQKCGKWHIGHYSAADDFGRRDYWRTRMEPRELKAGTIVHINGIPVRLVNSVIAETAKGNWTLIDEPLTTPADASWGQTANQNSQP